MADDKQKLAEGTEKAQEIATKQEQAAKIEIGTSEDGIRVAKPGGQPHPNSQQAANLAEEMITSAVREYKGAKAGLIKAAEYFVTAQRMGGLSNDQIQANKVFAEAAALLDAIEDVDAPETKTPGELLMDKTKLIGPGHENDGQEVKPDPEKRMEGGALVPPTEDVTTVMKPVGQGDSSRGQAAKASAEGEAEDGLGGDGQPS